MPALLLRLWILLHLMIVTHLTIVIALFMTLDDNIYISLIQRRVSSLSVTRGGEWRVEGECHQTPSTHTVTYGQLATSSQVAMRLFKAILETYNAQIIIYLFFQNHPPLEC